MAAYAAAVAGGLLLAAPTRALDNGLARTPPMGWRSWNLYGEDVDQELMIRVMDGMVSRTRTVDGVPTSLCDLGYCDVGLDDAWQQCGKYGATKYTYHTEAGTPIVNRTRFPDMLQMTDYAHSLGLTAGWYFNNCICRDHCGDGHKYSETDDKCYRGDAAALQLYNFDGVKLDNCGLQTDLGVWAKLFNQSGKAIMIENCHWGETVPTEDFCPYNFYRSSGDIRARFSSVVRNLASVQKFADSGLSRPGCWAYPDMLEVGCKHGPGGAGDPGLNFEETKTHFAAWCIVSSPLVLSHDVNDDEIMDQVWPIITNKHALRVNQEYVGYSGGAFDVSVNTVMLNDEEGTVAAPHFQYFYKPLQQGHIAVLMINSGNFTAMLSINLSLVPGIVHGHTYSVRDVWSGTILYQKQANATIDAEIPSHGSGFYILEF